MEHLFTCDECGEDFTPEDGFPFGTNVTCPHCGTEFETDYETDYEDNCHAWLARRALADYAGGEGKG